MLINLSIQNVAVIEKAEVDFSEGFNILTGETGAGKSLLIDSLSMVLGMRTSRDLIRSGADFASVTALVSPCPDLSEFDITPEEDGSIVISRKLHSDGRNICKINSATVPLSTLKSVGEKLVTIHGQHDNIALLKPSYHLAVLDEYAQNNKILSQYKLLFAKATEAQKKLEAMRTSESEREMQKDTLSFRIEEIKAVDPKEGEDAELGEKRDALRNYSTIMANLDAAASALADGKDALHAAMNNVERAANFDKALGSISEQVTDLYYNAEDLSSQINSYVTRMSFSPAELDEVEERLDAITRLKKKYGSEIKDVLSNLALWEEEYGSLLFYDDNIALLEEEAKNAREEMLLTGKKLTETRLEAADKLSKVVEDELTFLDMPKVSFSVAINKHEPDTTGLCSVEFLISTAPGEAPKPLNRIASGGEMSRIMLALKSALADCDNVGILLFDEIDTGVSGKAAAKIAAKLKSLAKNKQIICITHLPQMACRANNHLLIQKDTTSDSFRTTVIPLDYQGRVEELSRLISGDEISAAARLAAEEMLKEDAQ